MCMEANEILFRAIVEQMNEAALVCDFERKILYANPKMCALLGYSLSELENKFSMDFFDEETRNTMLIHFRDFRSKGLASQYKGNLLTRSGDKIPVLVSGTPFEGIGTIGVYTDLREMKKKETEMFGNTFYLATILENSGDAIISADLNYLITSWNKGAEEMFGFTEAETLNKPVADLLIPDERKDELQKTRSDVRERGVIRNFKTVRKKKDGSLIYVSITMSPIKLPDSSINGYVTIYRDISLQNKWEQELNTRFDNLREAYQALGKKSRYMDYMDELLDIAVGKESIGNFHEYIVAAVAYITRVDACVLRTMDESGNKLHRGASYGVGDDWRGKDTINFKGSLAEAAFMKKQSVKVYNIASEPKYQSVKLAQKHGFFSLMVVPLFVRDKFFGSFSLYLKNDNQFDLFDNDFIDTFAKLISVALSKSAN